MDYLEKRTTDIPDFRTVNPNSSRLFNSFTAPSMAHQNYKPCINPFISAMNDISAYKAFLKKLFDVLLLDKYNPADFFLEEIKYLREVIIINE